MAAIVTTIGFSQTLEEFNIKTLGPANLNYRKSPDRVLIADFQVNFQTALRLEDQKKGGKMWRGGIKGDAKASIMVVLEGLTTNDLQTITDRLYEQYISRLTSKGLEVADVNELWNHQLYLKNREDRWELKSGGTVEKGNEFGIVTMRPSTQKFIVAKRTISEDAMPIASLADYEANVERKLVNQKTDFIYNKVVLEVNVFENSMSEAERTLNRHAGYAEVKAETNFKVSEESFNRFGMGQFYAKKGIGVSDVLKKQKFDASQGADVDKRGTDWGVIRVWQVDDKEEANFAVVECDVDKYLKASEIAGSAFLHGTLDEMMQKK